MIYRIGSFNVHNLNYPGSKNSVRDFDMIASIIKSEEFAVVALQEVLSYKVWEKLRIPLGANWKFAWEQPAPETGGDKADHRGEGYAYIWDSSKVDLVEINVDGAIRTFMPRIWHQYRKNGTKLVREPYYARFTPRGKNAGCFCEIRLINTHIVYGDSNKLGETMRYCEFLKLVSNVYENVANKRYGDGMPAYVVVLGDYNLSLETLHALETISQSPTMVSVGNSKAERQLERVITIQGELTTLNHVQQDDGTYTSNYANNYDHFSFMEAYQSIMHINVGRVDVTRYCSDLSQYWKSVSDHVPIVMEIDLNKRNV